jgi:4-hydroxy-tetrahydrodipicolinate synthase
LSKSPLRGVIAATATPVTAELEPDLGRFVALCRFLLDEGCDGLNICGTTGEATSLTVAQRLAVMQAAADALPLEQLMVGTGAAAVGDAIALTRRAAEIGFAGALLLPPFYYKGIADDGVVAYIGAVAGATQDRPIPLYLYNFPALSGVEYSVPLVKLLLAKFGGRIAGLKDSSGNMDYAREVAALSPDLAVFPSNEAVLLKARAGEFAGCISASANINARYCARAFHAGDEAALALATRIRALASRKPLIASVKAVLAHRLSDVAFERLLPPLTPLTEPDRRALVRDFDACMAA